jgi:hypothetical protein
LSESIRESHPTSDELVHVQFRNFRNTCKACVGNYSEHYWFSFFVGAILGTTKSQETIVHKVEKYDSKWKIDQGTQSVKYCCNNDRENAPTVVCGN